MDLKERQQELLNLLLGTKYEEEKIKNLKMEECILLHHSALQMMLANRNDENKFKFMENRSKFFYIQVLERLRTMDEIFVIYSKTDALPYVVCDEKTFDDQIYLYTTQEAADKMAEKLEAEKNPVEVVRYENSQFLKFYLSLYTMGVNAMLINSLQLAIRVQLKELCKAPDYSKFEEEKRPALNPELQLTAMYFIQEVRRPIPNEEKKNLKELEEEIHANLANGRYFTLVRTSKNEDGEERMEMPLVKATKGDSFQPIFTDLNELERFPGYEDFKIVIFNYEGIKKIIPTQAQGVIVNPHGVRLVLYRSQMK